MPTPAMDEVLYKALADRLENWFRVHGRRFPWRTVQDPYVILATEFLLQRTRAEAVEKIYERFFSRYRTIEELASASSVELQGFFARLGLLYRGERLREVAKQVVKQYGGKVPCDLDKLLRLSGVGVYIASAVLNFGCNVTTPVVDKNVLRVLNRVANIVTESDARVFISGLYTHGDHRVLAYALIDLGATVCIEPPRCRSCPVDDLCKKYPLKKNAWRMLRKIVTRDGRVKLHEQPVSSAKEG